ncbi:glycosyltransferase family 2 protein [Anaerostipes faecalis]|uniref:glycosyltransferase family 2 protein n=1 Tax=Anaerostipes faecalis TaxID=2738446 RepID=UPI003F078008
MKFEVNMKISVIIPVYNCEKYLQTCLESVITQSHRDLEIIIIDDGSTDSSGNICDRFAENDSRIIVIHQNNKGVSASRNVGIERMSGELVSFIDADDTLDPDMYEFLCSLMAEYDANITHCGYRHVVGKEIRLVHGSQQIIEQNREEAIKCLIGGELFVGSLWNKLYKAELIKEVQFNEKIKINEDILFNFQVFLKADKIVFADYTKYNYIAHRDSSACFVTPDLRKAADACSVNQFIYEHSTETVYGTIAAERWMRSLSGYYRVCYKTHHKDKQAVIRETLWQLYCRNPDIGKNMKITAIMLKCMPWIYILIYSIYDKIRKPNWEV